ncbi:hypothetical protein JCGZ_11222 [Jatropha curcas]|uniref:Uncharacterized protein n=1 Tax=Jatropha curcas TaxID=180498 RepID=A0A067KR91_JATCU|nr:hypothetical protein JCGZ_11222 [Jatropha curcas]
MKVTIEKTEIVKPFCDGNKIPTDPKSHLVPLSVFDKVSYNTHVAIIYADNPPTPTNGTIELGLQKVLSEYREWAGRLGEDENGDPVIFLNDKGVNFVEASIDIKLEQVMPLQPSPFLLSLHPKVKDVEALLQVQLTRFACGSLVIGFTAHHLVADGHSASNFLVAWGKATRGLDINPLPLHDRTIFNPRNPPYFEFEHKGVEFKCKNLVNDCSNYDGMSVEEVEVHKVHFTMEFLSELKTRASNSLPNGANGNNKPYTTFESLLAHLWRTMTKARQLNGFENSSIRISVNGCARMNPKVPNEYFRNLVLWAYPSSKVEDLVQETSGYAAELIRPEFFTCNSTLNRILYPRQYKLINLVATML